MLAAGMRDTVLARLSAVGLVHVRVDDGNINDLEEE